MTHTVWLHPFLGYQPPVKVAESLLILLSRKPSEAARDEGSVDTSLDLLCEAFPGFEREIAGKDVLDFGCGAGLQSAAMALGGARCVLGLDTNPRTLDRARELAASLGLRDKIELAERLQSRHKGAFDLVISQNSMEHFSDPVAALEEMKSALTPGGRILITFGPLWLSPYGSHMSFFTSVPWVNILFPEKAVMSVRSRHIDDGAMRYEDVEGGLNKMTVRKFERLVEQCDLKVTYRRYRCVKGLGFLGRLPLARELFINHVSCILQAP